MLNKAGVIFLVFVSGCLALPRKPAILNLVNEETRKALEDLVGSNQIADVTGIFNGFNYNISKIRINSLTMPASDLDLLTDQGNGFIWRANGGGLTVSADWRVTKAGWFKIDVNGSVAATISGLNFTLKLHVDSEAGKMTIASDGCSGTVGAVDLKMEGAFSIVFTALKGVLDKMAKDALPDVLCAAVRLFVDKNSQRLGRRLLE